MKPLFPGYIFVSLYLGRDRWRSINGTPGVSHLITFSDRPAPLPDVLIEKIMTSIDFGGHFCFENELRKGSEVRPLPGPLENPIGKIQQLDDTGRITILLEIMGRHVPIRSDSKELIAVN